MQDNIRIGMSADFSLAYIDLLRSQGSKRTSRRKVHANNSIPSQVTPSTIPNVTLPLAFLFSGDGSFECPFYLDPNDVLLRAVPSVAGLSRFIHLDWVDFVAEVRND